MKRLVFFLLFMALGAISSLQAQSITIGATERPTVYKSFGNHIGEIALELLPNDKFVIYYYSFSDKKMKKVKGKWSKRAKKVKLRFKASEDLDQLFAANMKSPSSSFEIVDERTIRFSLNDKGIFIWGVYCIKQ